MSQLKNNSLEDIEPASKIFEPRNKEEILEPDQQQTCCQSFKKKMQDCRDILANYFQCVRVFSNQKLEDLRRKALQYQRQQEKLHNKSSTSQLSETFTEKMSQFEHKDQFKTYTRKEKILLVEDYNELPVHNYSTNQKLRFTKRYAELYDKSYSERKKRFGYTFEQVEFQRQKQYEKKEKNFWHQLKRLICCRGGNLLEDIQQRQLETDGRSSLNNQEQDKKTNKQPSLSNKNKNKQNNIFLFQDQNENKQSPKQVGISKYGHKVNKNINYIGQTQIKQDDQDMRKSSSIFNRDSQEGEARKISSRLGVDTELLIKRKQYEEKAHNEYDYQENGIQEYNLNNKNAQKDKNNQNSSDTTGSNPNMNYSAEDYRNQVEINREQEDYNRFQSSKMSRKKYQDGVAKMKNKKAKISSLFQQVEDQNDQQFDPNQVIFSSQDVNKINKNDTQVQNSSEFNNIQNENNISTTSHYNNLNNTSQSIDQRSENYQNLNESHNDSQIASNYQRVKKSKNKNKAKKFNENNNDQSQEIPSFQEPSQLNDDSGVVLDNSNINDSYQSMPLNHSGRGKNNQSQLILKENKNILDELNDIPEADTSLHAETSAFKKKRKQKKRLVKEQSQDRDDTIIMEENVDQSMYQQGNNYSNNSNSYYQDSSYIDQNNSTVHNEIGELKNPQQMIKKKKNKRKNLVIEQSDHQQLVDIEDL